MRDFDSAADTQQAESGSARRKTAGCLKKAGIFSRKMGNFRGKVGHFSPVGGAHGLRLGGNDGGLAASVKIEADKPRNTGHNGTKSPEDRDIPQSSGRMWGMAAETNGRHFGSTLICSRRWSVPCR